MVRKPPWKPGRFIRLETGIRGPSGTCRRTLAKIKRLSGALVTAAPGGPTHPSPLVFRRTPAAETPLSLSWGFRYERKADMALRHDQRVCIFHPGGLGDLVLASELVGSLKHAHPAAHVSLMCRAELVSVIGLYPIPPDEIIPLPQNPYLWTELSVELVAALEPLAGELRARQADLFIAAALKPTWFSSFAAAMLAPKTAICTGDPAVTRNFLAFILDRFQAGVPSLHSVEIPPDSHERERYRRILEFLQIPYQPQFPWQLPATLQSAASTRIESLGLRPREYVICFPAGSPSTSIKRWPASSFVAALAHIGKKWNLQPLFIGDSSDRERLEWYMEALRDKGAHPRMFCGGTDDIPLIAAIVSLARAYVGNDTGPMHLAQAYEVPGVGVFGGGHGQRYAPWATGSLGAAHPLPCFGCDWDCAFDRGLCVDKIPVDAIIGAFDEILDDSPPPPELREVSMVSTETKEILGLASAKYRAAQKDRAERLEAILQLSRSQHQTAQLLKDAEAKARALSSEAERRERALNEGGAIILLRDTQLAELARVAAERLEALESEHASLLQWQAEAGQRAAGLGEYERIVAARGTRIVELERVAAERLEALESEHASLLQWQAEAGQRAAGLGEYERIVAARDTRIAELERVAAERLEALESEHASLLQWQAEAGQRAAGLGEYERIVAARDTRIAELEQANLERQAESEDLRSSLLAATGAAEEFSQKLHSALATLEQERVAHDRISAELSVSLAKEELLSQELLALRNESLLHSVIRRIQNSNFRR
jgi:ADP-heptose:LPS heptosyltransferase